MPRLLILLLSISVTPAFSAPPATDFMELSGFSYERAPESAAASRERYEGDGAELRFSWLAGEYVGLNGRFRRTTSEPAGLAAPERKEDYYEVAMMYAAPVTERTLVIVELGLAGERAEIRDGAGDSVRDHSDPSLYAALGIRTRRGWFEAGVRSAGQNFHGIRRQTHSADFRFHLSERFAISLNYETWDRDLMRTQRLGGGVQFKF